MTPRFILAKYVPDLGRMEPKNIGVFVWWKGAMRARFLTDAHAAEIVNDVATYKRWTAFWSRKIEGGEFAPTRGKPVSMKDPKCIDALVSTQKGNYILVDSGELLRKVPIREMNDVVDFLFNELVEPIPGAMAKKDTSFASRCSQVLTTAGVEFKKREPIECTWKGVTRHLHPDYYIGNGTPDGILQRARMTNEHSVNHAALTIFNLLEVGVVEPRQCRFLYRSQDMDGKTAEEGMKLFERMCKSINVDSEKAVDQLSVFATASAAADRLNGQ